MLTPHAQINPARALRLVFLVFPLFAVSLAHAQSLAPRHNSPTVSEDRAVALVKQLESQVRIYRSLGEFEADGRLARVPLKAFEMELARVNAELGSILPEIPAGSVRNEIMNALDSYRDGLYWWRQVDQPRVVHVNSLAATAQPRTNADAAFLSTIPYTVAIHWRQAHKYLARAENALK